MKSRRQRILKKLDDHGTWIKGKPLAAMLDVTDRTIRSDVEEINKQYPGVIESSTRDGYRINRVIYQTLNLHRKAIPQTPEERSLYIIKQLLFHKNELTFMALRDTLFISDNTIEGDIKRLRTMLKPYPGIKLVREQNSIHFTGTEQIKRRLYRDLLSNEIHGNFLNLDRTAALYEKFDLLRIVTVLEDTLADHQYKLRETSIPMIIIHVGITIERMLSGNYLKVIQSKIPDDAVELIIAKELFEKITKIVPVEYRETEVRAIAQLLMGYKHARLPDTDVAIGDKTIRVSQMVQEISDYLSETFDLDFSSDDDFQSGLHLHLQSLLMRVEKEMIIPNAHLDEIKVRYPLVFEMGLHVTRFIEGKIGYQVSEAEVGFIALHIGAAYDRMTMKHKHQVILISPNNQNFAKLTVGKIENVFGARLEIVDIIPYFVERDIASRNVDLILTLSPIDHALSIPTITISMFVNQEDESNIFIALNELDKRRFNLEFARHFGKLIDKRFYYTDLEGDTPEAIIRTMSAELVEAGYVSETFTQSVLERETMSSTSFDYALAIPHPLKMESKISVISIATLKKPIEWGNFNVKLVILLAISESDSSTMWLFFDWLSETISNAEKMTKLIEARDRDDFVHWMMHE